MGKISRTIHLAQASWAVLRADMELVLLPIISGVASLIVAATFLVPLLFVGDAEALAGPGGYIVMFLLYVVLAYITIFFNVALVAAADERLRGGDPTLGSALRAAASRAGHILPWAIVSATVSMILRAIEERAGFVGRLIAGFAGMAWTVVTFLVLPVLVFEGVGVVDAVKRSAELLKHTWGENIAAQVGFGILGVIAAIPAVAVVFLGFAAGATFGIAAVAIAVVWVLAVSVVLSAMNGIFQTALYHYATTGSVPGTAFSSTAMHGAFSPKR